MKGPKGRSDREIRVAIVGAGNCANSLVQGLEFYRQDPAETIGLMNPEIGGYWVGDILPVAAFEVDARKVGKDLAEATFAQPNVAYRYPGVQLDATGVQVMMGSVLDGVPPHLEGIVQVSDASPCDVAAVLKEAGAEVAITGASTPTRVPAMTDQPLDVTGAGDAFTAGFLASYLQSGDPIRASAYACATSAVVIEKTGGVCLDRMPTAQEAEARLSQWQRR